MILLPSIWYFTQYCIWYLLKHDQQEIFYTIQKWNRYCWLNRKCWWQYLKLANVNCDISLVIVKETTVHSVMLLRHTRGSFYGELCVKSPKEHNLCCQGNGELGIECCDWSVSKWPFELQPLLNISNNKGTTFSSARYDILVVFIFIEFNVSRDLFQEAWKEMAVFVKTTNQICRCYSQWQCFDGLVQHYVLFSVRIF